jgi:hypothetical protein
MCKLTQKCERPELSKVHEFLRRHNSLIVHFSGTPKGGGSNFNYLFPADLNQVIAGNAMGGVACSVVRPGDIFHGTGERNAFGSIGVILDFKSKHSLVAADPHDCGSRVENGVRVVQVERPVITLADLERTFSARISHNEWIVRDYVVLGIFAIPPCEVWALQKLPHVEDLPDYLSQEQFAEGPRKLTLRELVGTFPNQPILSFHNGQVHRLVPLPGPIDHAQVYRMPER